GLRALGSLSVARLAGGRESSDHSNERRSSPRSHPPAAIPTVASSWTVSPIRGAAGAEVASTSGSDAPQSATSRVTRAGLLLSTPLETTSSSTYGPGTSGTNVGV